MLLLPLTCLSGCNILAYPVYLIFGDDHPKVAAEYIGLADKHVALMISGHPGIEYEYPGVTTNLALISAHQISQHVDNVSFVDQERIESFQRQNPQWIGLGTQPIKQQLNAQRLIYVELVQLSLMEENSVNLLRGRLITEIEIYDLETADSKDPVYQTQIQIVVPESQPVYQSREAQQKIEQALLAAFAKKLAWKFHDHNESRK